MVVVGGVFNLPDGGGSRKRRDSSFRVLVRRDELLPPIGLALVFGPDTQFQIPLVPILGFPQIDGTSVDPALHLDVHTLGVETKGEVPGIAISTLLVLPAGRTADVIVAGAGGAKTTAAATAALAGAAAGFRGVGLLAGAEGDPGKYVFVGCEGRDRGRGIGGICVGTQALSGLVGFHVAFELAEDGVIVATVDGGAASGFATAVAGGIGGDWFKF